MLGVAMGFLVRNLHVVVFALISVLSALWVSSNPQGVITLVRPWVEDAVELKVLANEAYDDVREVSWDEASEEAVSIYVETLRMPTRLFERLSEKLEKVEREMSSRSSAEAEMGQDDIRAFRSARFEFVETGESL